MKPKEIFMSHIYAESYLNFTEEYLSQLKASIELMRRGNIDGNAVSNRDGDENKVICDINYKGDINWPHKHQGNLAGVFYLDTHENCGDLILDSFNFNQHCKISSYLSSKEKVIVVPKNNKIVLFDSNCMHYVTKNLSDKIRISMSFNIKIYD